MNEENWKLSHTIALVMTIFFGGSSGIQAYKYYREPAMQHDAAFSLEEKVEMFAKLREMRHDINDIKLHLQSLDLSIKSAKAVIVNRPGLACVDKTIKNGG